MPDELRAVLPIRDYGAPMRSSRAAGWGDVRITLIERERTGPVAQRFALPWHAFRLGVSGAFARGSTMRLDGRPPVPLAGRASFYPAGTEIRNAVAGASRLTYLMVEIDRDPAAEADEPGTASPVPIVELTDPLCLALLDALRREVERPAAVQRLFCETAALTLLLAAVRPAAPAPTQRGGLPPRQLARVTGYLEDRLAEEVGLGEVAELVRLSRSHLCRAFKASTGTTLHRWQREARLARARDLMRTKSLSLAQVAAATGFADQSHFTTAFRRSLGVTPGVWRRAHGLVPREVDPPLPPS